jgi:predicted aspartyl protease
MLVANAADHTANGAELQLQGPKVEIEIAVPTVLAEFLERSGLPVPPPQRGFALIDTGASITAVDEEVVASLGIQPIGQMKLSTPSRSMPAWLYAARLTCAGMAVLEVLDIVGCSLQPQGFIALLGRNFLRSVVLVYDGPAGVFTIR